MRRAGQTTKGVRIVVANAVVGTIGDGGVCAGVLHGGDRGGVEVREWGVEGPYRVSGERGVLHYRRWTQSSTLASDQ